MIAHTPAALLHQAWREYSFRPQRLFFPTTHPTFQPFCRAIPEGPFLFRVSRKKTNTTAECHGPCMNVLCVVLIIPPPIISATYFFLFPPPITREYSATYYSATYYSATLLSYLWFGSSPAYLRTTNECNLSNVSGVIDRYEDFQKCVSGRDCR